MTIYNLILNTRTGAKLFFKNQDNSFMKTLAAISLFAEIILFVAISLMVFNWASESLLPALSFITMLSITSAYMVFRFSFGSEAHTRYLERRAELGLDYNERPLYKEHIETSSSQTKNNKKSAESETFDIDEKVLEEWANELGKDMR